MGGEREAEAVWNGAGCMRNRIAMKVGRRENWEQEGGSLSSGGASWNLTPFSALIRLPGSTRTCTNYIAGISPSRPDETAEAYQCKLMFLCLKKACRGQNSPMGCSRCHVDDTAGCYVMLRWIGLWMTCHALILCLLPSMRSPCKNSGQPNSKLLGHHRHSGSQMGTTASYWSRSADGGTLRESWHSSPSPRYGRRPTIGLLKSCSSNLLVKTWGPLCWVARLDTEVRIWQ